MCTKFLPITLQSPNFKQQKYCSNIFANPWVFFSYSEHAEQKEPTMSFRLVSKAMRV